MKAVRRSHSTRRGGGTSRRRGVATVEMAILLPPLVLLLFGTLEMGMMARHSQSLNHVAREAARVAATGATVSRIQSHIADSAPGLDPESITVALDYRAWDEFSQTWGSWTALADADGENIAQTGDQIRVTLHYPYEVVTGPLLAGLLSDSGDSTIEIDATIVAMRE